MLQCVKKDLAIQSRKSKRHRPAKTDIIDYGKPEQQYVLAANPGAPYDPSYAVHTASYGTGHAKVRKGLQPTLPHRMAIVKASSRHNYPE
jgi:hypothetical protein